MFCPHVGSAVLKGAKTVKEAQPPAEKSPVDNLLSYFCFLVFIVVIVFTFQLKMFLPSAAFWAGGIELIVVLCLNSETGLIRDLIFRAES